jgi:hypothetical protein
VSGVPGDPRWLKAHGIDPEVWRTRGVWRYDTTDREAVKAAFREYLPPNKLRGVGRAVSLSPGLVLVKHAPPGFPPVIPQLRPDDEILINPEIKWHYHGSKRRPLKPWERARSHDLDKQGVKHGSRDNPGMLWGAVAEKHIRKDKGQHYDHKTGFGSHYGENREDFHFHRKKGKYVLFSKRHRWDREGRSKRIDLHPRALAKLARAERVFFAIEGTLKNDALLSAGEAVFSVPSVTVWDPDQLTRFAREFLVGRTVFIVPDADWFHNQLVDSQAFLIRTCLRDVPGVSAHVAAPPAGHTECKCKPVGQVSNGESCDHCGGFLKGIDDFLGAGGMVEDLVVRCREVPHDQIAHWGLVVTGLRIDRLRRAIYALEGLSLHALPDEDDADWIETPTVYLPLPTVARIMRTRNRAVEQTLIDLEERGAITCVSGSFQIKIREYDGKRVLDWEDEKPRILVREDLRARFESLRLGEFWNPFAEKAA